MRAVCRIARKCVGGSDGTRAGGLLRVGESETSRETSLALQAALFAFAPHFRRFSASQLYLRLALVLMPIGVLSTWFFETFDIGVLDFFFINAVINGCCMAVWVPLMLYVNIKYLPKGARPHAINIVMVSIAGLIYLSFGVYTFWNKLSSMF